LQRIYKELKDKNVAIELYRTSAIAQLPFVADENKELLNIVVHVNLKPWYIPAFEVGAKHVAAPNLYFMSFGSPPPALYTECSYGTYIKISDVAPSAAVDDDIIRSLMESEYRFDMYTGAYTADCKDDGYVRIKRDTLIQVIPVN